jgi:ligand-binding sensor domain-containing protein
MLRRRPPPRSRWIRWVLTTIAISALPPWSSAEEVAAPPPGSARFQHFTVENGLSQNTVRAILQDRTGLLWFATEEGLNRFDGYSFVPFKHRNGDAGSLPDDVVTALLEDGAGQMWVGTRTGLALFDTRMETFHLRLTTPRAVRALLEDRAGSLWIATEGAGVYRLDKGGAPPIHYQHSADDAGSLAHDNVYALFQDRNGQVWVGTYGGGLDLYDRATDRFRHRRHDAKDPTSLADDSVWCLAEDKDGRIWVGTERGVSVLAPDGMPLRRFRADASNPKALHNDMVTSIFVDRSGIPWLGTDAGLDRFVREDETFVAYAYSPDNPESLTRNAVRAVFEDAQENLWVSTYARGLNLLQKKGHPFRYYTYEAHARGGLSDRSVNAFLEDREGAIWLGTAEGGLHRFHAGGPQTFTQHGSVHAPLLALYQDRRGRLWLGTWDKGLHSFDPARGTFTDHQPRIDDPETREDNRIWAITEDADGSLLIATNAAGIVHYDPETGRVFRERHDPKRPESLGDDQVRAFDRDAQGNLWVATLGAGLDMRRADGSGYVHYRHDPRQAGTISEDAAMSLHRDKQGRLWVGTEGGGLNLLEVETGRFTTFTTADGLPSNRVVAIRDDEDGKLWLSTNRGLCRFDPSRARRPESFDLTNGLQSLHFNLGAALRTRAGKMMFGSENGLYWFDPARITPNLQVPPIVLTSLKVLNEPRKTDVGSSPAEEIRLRHFEKIFSLEFAVLDYTFPRRNTYAYKLEGFDHDWIEIGSRREVTFTNLDPGEYVLHVKGSNSDGVWDEKGKSLRIVVTPPLTATWWFRLLSAGTFLALLFGAHRWRLALVEAREHELQLRVDEAMSRVKILKGLLPICATCKKVRDDKGYWNQIEQYISDHSEADFSHGICPDCIAKYYPRHRGGKA